MIDASLSRALARAALLLLPALAACSYPGPAAVDPTREWRVAGGDAANAQYSRLAQINTSNVAELEMAWAYHSGDKRGEDRSQIQCNPIIVDSVLYATSPQLKVLALDAAEGDLIWSFDPFPGQEQPPDEDSADVDEGKNDDGEKKANAAAIGVNRGVVYWEDGPDKRILLTAGQDLIALNAQTGQLIENFGESGMVDLREGLGRDPSKLFVLANSPGIVYGDLLIQGSRVNEGPDSSPGHIRAYDIRTGAIAWTFHTVPRPGELGYDTWPPDAWQRNGGANAWAPMSVDEERGLVFVPTGSAAYDFYGGDRLGENLFANCLLALDAKTGERVWHYQFVHHDLWDRDLPAAPNLVTVERDGHRIDAVAQVTKSGHVFVFERDGGRPLFEIEERQVAASDLEGEKAWPTQPFPLAPPPFARQIFSEEEVTDISNDSRAFALERLRSVRTGSPFIPPSREGTIIFPGFDGGAEWGGAAYDPDSRLLYVNANEMPWILTMVPVKTEEGGSWADRGKELYTSLCAVCHGADRRGDQARTFPSLHDLAKRLDPNQARQSIRKGKGVMPGYPSLREKHLTGLIAYLYGQSDAQVGASRPEEKEEKPWQMPYSHTGYHRFLDPEGYPAVKPPWGTLNAIDLDEGTIVWQVPLGEFADLTKRGIAPTGTENYGGPIVTAGGLIFIAATKDEKFRAFDKQTGRILWETELPAGGYATPATYEVGGRQYVVIAAGGGKMGTKSGDSYIAFALPQ